MSTTGDYAERMVARTSTGPTRWVRILWRGGPATLVFRALLVELIIGLGLFVVVLPFATMKNDGSPLAAIFGPAVGMPLGVWLIFVAVVVGAQTLVGLALRPRAAWLRALGAFAAFLIAAFCALWMALVVAQIALMAASGFARSSGDPLDAVGVVLFLPIAIVVGVLNGRAAFVEMQELRGVVRTA
jgi:hypothetical protein